MSLPGRQIYIFLTLIFFFFYVPSGASYFYFLTSRKLYYMKFVIFDVARCRMSATSLTFLLLYFFKCLHPRSVQEAYVVTFFGCMSPGPSVHPSSHSMIKENLLVGFHTCTCLRDTTWGVDLHWFNRFWRNLPTVKGHRTLAKSNFKKTIFSARTLVRNILWWWNLVGSIDIGLHDKTIETCGSSRSKVLAACG